MQPLVRVALFASLFIGHARAQAPQPVTPVGLPIPGAPVLDTHPTLTKAATVKITGSSPDATEIEVAGPRGVFRIPVTAGRFATVLPLIANRTNPFHFTAIFDDLRSATTLTRVTRDNQPPHLFIDGPDDGARVTVTKVDVFGRVGDALSGFKNLMVTVNDAKAQVNVGIGTNGTFFAMGVPLLVSSPPEATEIRVFASDDFGNRAGRSVWVTHVPIPPGVPKMEIPPLKGGNGQEGQMRSQLPKPIVVKVLDGNGKPFAGKSLTFEVVRSDGLLKPLIGGKGSRVLQLRADKLGLAKVLWTLGTDAGSGNNRVRVTARDIAGTILFCASAKPAPPRQINVATGDHEVAAVSSPAPEPLRVWVNDGCNGLAGKRVTFKVVRGSGKVNGESEITVQTDRTGHASVRFVLGPEPITQRVEADVTNNSRFPAVFEIQGIARQERTPASFVGRVVDNSDQAIGNCPIHLSVNHKLLPTVWTDKDGRFRIDKILESGEGVLVAEASEATRLGEKTIPKKSFPDMMFHPVLVPNAENRLGAPIRIPPLDLGSARVVDGTKDVTLTCSAIQGLEFRIPKGRILWKGEPVTPQRPVTVSLSQVHFDEIPMALPDGAAPPFAWTLQPAGLLFEKPVQITMPNMVGLAPSSIVYFLSFDHDLGRFLIVATGSVSKDGASLVSDPGSGIRKSGWGGFCPPYPSVGVVAVDAWRDALEAILDYLAKIKGADGPRDFALAELMLCSAKRSFAYDPVRQQQGRRPAWSQDFLELLFVTLANRLPEEAKIRLAFPSPFRDSVRLQVPSWLAVPGKLSSEDASLVAEGIGQHHWWHLASLYGSVVPDLLRQGWTAARIRSEHGNLFERALAPCLDELVTGRVISPWVAAAGKESVRGISRQLLETTIALEPALAPLDFGKLPSLPALPPALGQTELFSPAIAAAGTLQVTAPGFFASVGSPVQLKVIHKVTKKDLTKGSTGTRYFATDGDQIVEVSVDGLLSLRWTPSCLPNQRPRLWVFAVNGTPATDFGIGQLAIRDVDTDKDLIVDSYETLVGLDPKLANAPDADQDKDGLRDLHECVIGTNPKISDTDRDQVPDGVEVGQGSDPLNPASTTPRVNRSFSVAVSTQTGRASAAGSFRVANVPTSANPVRVRMRGRANLKAAYASSEYFDVVNQRTYRPASVSTSHQPIPTPLSLQALVQKPVLTKLNEPTRVLVTGLMSPDKTRVDLSLRSLGTTYAISNPAIATVDANGGLLARGRGTAYITASNEGATTVVPVTVSPGDPLTRVEGFVLLPDKKPPVPKPTISVHPGGSLPYEYQASGKFVVPGVPALLGKIYVTVEVQVGSRNLIGTAGPLEPFPSGVTDAGVIMLSDAVSWNTDKSGSWHRAGNWSGNRVPGPKDRVLIHRPNATTPPTVTISSGTVVVEALVHRERLTLSGGSLQITTPFNNEGDFRITGGTLRRTTVSGKPIIATGGTLEDVRVDGEIVVPSGTVNVSGLVVNGTSITPGKVTVTGTLAFADSETIAGSGEVVLTGGFLNPGSGGLTIGPKLCVRGQGTVGRLGVPLLNLGKIRMDTTGTLRVTGTAWSNLGSLQVTGSGTLSLEGSWTNEGAFDVLRVGVLNLGGEFRLAEGTSFKRTSGTVNLTGRLWNTGKVLRLDASTGSWVVRDSGSIVDGTVETASGIRLDFLGGYLDAVTLKGDARILDGGWLSAAGNLTLDGGKVSFASNKAWTYLYILGDGRITRTRTGTGEVVFAGRYNRIWQQNGTLLTIDPGITVHGGWGEIGQGSLDVINRGTIQAEKAGASIWVYGRSFRNENLLASTKGATLGVSVTRWTNNKSLKTDTKSVLTLTGRWDHNGSLDVSGGTANLDGVFTLAPTSSFTCTAGTVNLEGKLLNTGRTLTVPNNCSWTVRNGGLIEGGTVVVTPPNNKLIFQAGSLDGVTLTGNAKIPNGGWLSAHGNLTLAGGKVSFASNNAWTYLYILGDGRITGTGEVVFAGRYNRIWQQSGTLLTIDPGITVHGGWGEIGQASLDVINRGTIKAKKAGQWIWVYGRNFTNEAVLASTGGGGLGVSVTRWTNNKSLKTDTGSVLTLTGRWDHNGSLDVSGGTANLDGVFTLAPTSSFTCTAGTVNLEGKLLNTGRTLTVPINCSWNVRKSGFIEGGTVVVTPPNELVFQAGSLDGVTLTGDAKIPNGGWLSAHGNLTLAGGKVRFASTSSWTYLHLYNNSRITGSGEIVLGGRYNRIWQQSGTLLTIDPGITVHGGWGEIGQGSLDVLNRGTIRAETSGQWIWVYGRNFTNEAVLASTGGGGLGVSVTRWTNRKDLRTDKSTLTLTGRWDHNGSLDATDSTVNLDGIFTLARSSSFTRTGGTVNLEGKLLNTGETLALDANKGTWIVRDSGLIEGGTVVVTPPNELIFQAGSLDGVTLSGAAKIVNGGWLSAAGNLTLDGGKVSFASNKAWTYLYILGDGRITRTRTGTGEVVFAGRYNRIWQQNGTLLTIDPGITVHGGWGEIGRPGFDVLNKGTVRAEVSGATISAPGLSWINQGTASILTGATLGSTAPYVQTGATARTLLQGGTLSVPSGARITQGRLEGDGTINGKLELGGEMLPGGAGKIHVLRINGGYSQTASAIVHVDLERTPQVKQNDQVVITGQANFAGVGTLDVKWISPPQPVATDSFAVFTYASPSGKFKTHKLPPLTPPRSWAPPAYGATALNLKVQ